VKTRIKSRRGESFRKKLGFGLGSKPVGLTGRACQVAPYRVPDQLGERANREGNGPKPQLEKTGYMGEKTEKKRKRNRAAGGNSAHGQYKE
jgi:hypothetical protein